MSNISLIHKTAGRSLSSLLHGICFTSTALAVCYRTPADAVAASLKALPYSMSESGGYRVEKIQSDPVLNQSWVMIISCDHSGWPAVALPLRSSISQAQLRAQGGAKKVMTPLVVRAGDIVRLWRQESALRIEVAGISEGNGGLGDLIKVRLLRGNTDDQSIVEQFTGIVRGPSDVEMKP